MKGFGILLMLMNCFTILSASNSWIITILGIIGLSFSAIITAEEFKRR